MAASQSLYAVYLGVQGAAGAETPQILVNYTLSPLGERVGWGCR